MNPFEIPFNRPPRLRGLATRMKDVVWSGNTAAGGPYGAACEERLSAIQDAPVLLTTSCTHALEMAALLLDLSEGDEVLIPSFTFTSTATAFALRGARIRFVDCDSNGQIDLDQLEAIISHATKAVVPVHYAGNSCDMQRLVAIADRAGLVVVEDAAQALGSTCMGTPLGSFGALGAISFHETKNVSAGEGGALVVRETAHLDRAKRLRDKGTNRAEFLVGLTDKYTWVDVGSSWALSDINAACLDLQLGFLNAIGRRRAVLWQRYHDALKGPVARAGARLIGVPAHNVSNFHIFAIVWPERRLRDAFIEHMRSHGILTPFHYVSLHTSPFGRRYAREGERLPMSESLSDGLVRLPLFHDLSKQAQDRVVDVALDFVAHSC